MPPSPDATSGLRSLKKAAIRGGPAGAEHLVEDFAGDLAVDLPPLDQLQEGHQPFRGDRAVPEGAVGALHRPQEIAHDPVGHRFGLVEVGQAGLEIVGQFAAAGQDLGIQNAGYRTIASLHLEKGYADWGSELTPEYTPYDAGLGFCVALDKDDFLGKESLAKVKAEGPAWKLCSFTIDTSSPLMLQGSAPIIQDGKVLGVTSSSGYGHTVKKNICYGYIPADLADPNKEFEIEPNSTISWIGDPYEAILNIRAKRFPVTDMPPIGLPFF